MIPQIVEFVGDRPMIAHNAALDMGFLQGKYRVLQNNQRIDTFDLASVLLPRAPRYTLSSLTSVLGIEMAHAHRALDDARGAALLYDLLWQKMTLLPQALLQEIIDLSKGLNWDATAVFEAALREHRQERQSVPKTAVFNPLPEIPVPLTLNQKTPPPISLKELIGEDGLLAKNLPEYEHRPQQESMAQAVGRALENDSHLIVEAGTGTGKSFAYLIPAILWSLQHHQPVVVSTNTINLQDQLMQKDLPILRESLELDFDAAILKGRGNYLCPHRLDTVRRRRPTSLGELRTLIKVLVWLLESETGDKSEISLRGPIEHTVWHRLSAEDEGCTLHRCEATMAGGCPFYKARKAAEAANLLVVNHALLISDAASGSRVLPEYHHLIVDEAHQLEEAVTNGLSVHIDQSALTRRLADLGGPNRGLLGEILRNTGSIVPDKERLRLETFIQAIDEATRAMQGEIQRFFELIERFMKDVHNIRASDYTTLIRVTAQHRVRSSFAEVQNSWTILGEYFDVISDAMRRLNKALTKLRTYQIQGYEDFVTSTETAAQYLEEIKQQLQAFVVEPDRNTIYWLSIGNSQTDLPILHAAPLHVGPLVQQHLWSTKRAMVLTSATLRSGDNFGFIHDRLYAEGVETLEVGSPFNYRDSTLLYIPNDIPEPTDKNGYQKAIERGIIELAAALNGRVLVLFTSYSQLRQTAQAIGPRLALGGITIYDQSDGSSRQALVDGFKSTDKAVLLGTRSFWEGVDIPGDSLSALVITRLPFTVPTDPIFAARSETYNDQFNQYALPDAILRFRQGFGRLIRTRQDRGVVSVFDSRIVHKSYGTQFIEALPECTVRYGSLEGLAQTAVNWLK